MTTRTLLVSLFSAGAYGHGRLLDPITRVGHRSYENDPVGNAGSATFESDKWVCRHDYTPSVGRTSVTAGGELPVRYSLSADHVGDCAFYLSYDVDLPRSDMSWFKIANVPDCKKLDEQTFSIQLPDFLPAGNAVLRWDWYALHVSSSTPEMYVQCSDLAISAGASPTTVGEITPTYLAKDLYTAAETNAAPFRPGFGAGGNVGADGFFFSGYEPYGYESFCSADDGQWILATCWASASMQA
ncbi:hypothetical protein EMIHUDRAFT_248913 [Emiliania huxleyi CCMP1516]|uniref:lytic cellulose monooxygenase (C4-dehydrogenating) n=2 Tax=Emiliania huxleyi TaxID=2903 RepID=A0A0D3ICB0_EMIH1|nr:hypothetical protein EMIHUDRAFT_248913 [Emiliania huxleyi CCMP1516]EOD08895.1 hypothetical protein EMIHUDRAFT_248913 [Emiliania huxleyi CCMP1516]|eukprot:XP_005761324.1 hypothetical protein EMIHUDRAFT_248913 [Emiliania huxleyi CCMP1516]